MAKKTTVVGLDIGHFGVKAVWTVRHGDRVVIKRTESVRLPLDGSGRMEVIRPWVEKLQISRYPCVVGLSGQQTMFQPFLLPPGDPRNLQQAAAMEVVRFNEMAAETMVYGFTPISLAADEKRFLLAMSRQTVLDGLLDMAAGMKLNIVDIVPNPIALFNALAPLEASSSEVNMFVDVGHATTDIAIGSQAGLLFARSFSTGGGLFTDALAKKRAVSMAQAEHSKVTEPGLLLPTGSDDHGMSAACDMWLAEIQSSLSVYRSLYPGEKMRPGCLIMGGGGAKLSNFAQRVSAALSMDVRPVESVPGANKGEDSTFLLASGLAYSGWGLAQAPITLLPAEIRDELTFRQQKPFWIASAVAAGLILAVSLVGGFRDTGRKEAHRRAQQASLSRRQALVNDIERISARNEEILRMAMPVRDMLERGSVMRDVLTIVSETRAPSDWITMVCDADSYFGGEATPMPGTHTSSSRRGRPSPAQPGQVKQEHRLSRIMIEGYTLKQDLSTVQALIARLEEADFVESADLLSDDKLVGDAPGGVPHNAIRYVLDVKITNP